MSRFSPIFLLLTVFYLLLCTGCGSDDPIGPEEEMDPRHDVGDLVVDLSGGVQMAFVWIEPGTFMMGAREGEPSAGENKPQHQVTLTKGFYMAKYELVWQQWMSVMGKEPDSKSGQIFDTDYPVGVSRRLESGEFFTTLNALVQDQGLFFRLPTEAEWEYACRAGTTTIYSWGDETDIPVVEEHAWYDVNSDEHIHPVGKKKANPWGLYDMHGNACEWAEDWFAKYPSEPQVDPMISRPSDINPSFGGYVLRGGSIAYRAEGLSCATRTFGYDGGTLRVVAEKLE